ncbi:hypothetical protein Tco_1381990 [Tanacetum coccineum]
MNHQTSTVPQVAYQSPQAPTQLMTESPFVDSGFAVPMYSPEDDLIACLNKAMVFLMAIASSRFPTTNNQLRTSSNPRNQATIQDGRVTGNTYSSSSNNSFGLVPIASPTLSLFHDDPYMKVMHAYYAKELPIPPPTIVPPSSMLSPMFNP